MAVITASSSFNNKDVDLSGWLEPTRSYTLLDNVNFTSLQGNTYEDALRITWSDDPNYREFWLGTGLAFDPVTKAFTAGTITGFVGENFVGGSWVQDLAIEGFSVAASTVSTALSSASTADDEALLEQIFSGNDTFNLSNQNDDAWGYAGNDTINGNGGNDSLHGGEDDDSLAGGDGNDFLDGGNGDDVLDGGAGSDWADYRDADAAVSVNLGAAGAQNTVGAGSDTLVDVEGVVGSDFADSLTGGSGNGVFELFSGGAGDDTIDGGVVTDTAAFTDGNQIEYWLTANSGVNVNLKLGSATDGEGGTDTLENFNFVVGSRFADTITGSDSNVFEAFNGLAGADFFDGGDLSKASARINYNTSPAAVTVDLAAGSAQDGHGSTDTFVNINFVRGSNFNDTLRGSDATAYTELFEGRAGNDLIDGRGGRDQVRYDNAGGAVVVNLATGSATGADGNDTLIGIEEARGSNGFGDTLTGDAGDNRFEGRGGDDSLAGGDGQDTLLGGTGNDTLDGGAQPDAVADETGAFPASLLYFDVADYSQASGSVNVDLGAGTATGADGNDTLIGIEAVRGSAFDDTLVGDSGHNVLRGNAGNDSLVGGDGFDIADMGHATTAINASLASGVVTGGAGNDTLNGIEMLIGGSGNDTLAGDAQNNVIRGNAGNDSMTGGSGIDMVDFRAASGGVTASLATGTSSGGDGNDTFGGFEQLRGSEHGDSLAGDGGANAIYGRGGADVLVGGAGDDYLDGGTIADLVNYTDANTVDYSASTAGVNVDLATGTAQDGLGGTDTLVDIDLVIGTAHNDTLTGSTALLFEQFSPGAGNDTVDGGAVTDTLNFDNSNRVSYANTDQSVTVDLALGTATGAAIGSDTLVNINQAAGSSANDTLRGSSGLLDEAFRGHAGNDLIDGRGGFDFARYDTAGSTGANVNLATGTAQDGLGGTDTLISIEGARGSGADDTLIGGNAASNALERFIGLAGDDSINGGSGFDRAEYHLSPGAVTVTLGGAAAGSAQDGYGNTDTLVSIEAVRGSINDDRLTGSSVATLESFDGREGNDTIDGVAGLDLVDYHYSTAGVVVDLATGSALDGYGGVDRLLNVDDVLGSRDFADSIVGSAGNNRLDGQGGNDTIGGGAGNDTLVGGAGNDALTGGTGNDSMVGDSGADTMAGGDGNDTYVVGTGDLVSETGTVSSTADLVLASINWSLSGTGQAKVERLTLTGSTAVSGIGNEIANLITGNAIANTLNGNGGNDTLVGGSGNDSLTGGTGNDSLVGDAGNDTLVGGDGSDTYVVGAGDLVSETGTVSSAADLVQSSITWSLTGAGQAAIERLTLTGTGGIGGTGNGLANLITGNSGANSLNGGLNNDTLVGGGGNDTLTGGDGNDSLVGDAGNDSMVGGNGSDTYVVGTGDLVNETGAVSSTADLVQSSVGWSIAVAGQTAIERLTLTGTLGISGTGNDLANLITGNSGANALSGGLGNDTLVGGGGNDTLTGGTGNDSMVGGDGSDTYVVDAGDVVNETGTVSSAADLVKSSVGWSLAAGAGQAAVERLTLTGTLGINGTGNNLANVITGNSGANALNGGLGNDTLVGGGGNDTLTGGDGNDSLVGDAGADAMVGGNGSDTYVVGTGDLVSETGSVSSAADLVQSSITWSLSGAGQAAIERLTLTGTGAINGTGNGLANVITGNSGANKLDGGSGNDTLVGGGGNDTLTGGTGNDSMAGGDGSDTYVVGTGDVISETGSVASAADLVQSSITWSLSGAGQAAIERLALIGSSAINGTGNDIANVITGNGSANRLTGGRGNDSLSGGLGNDTLVGGAGNDTLAGGAGIDVLRFDAPLSATTNVDSVSGFVAADDTFQLENAVFVGLATGPLAAAAFRVGAAATTASQRIVYNPATGQLFFDADGSGAVAQVLFATVAPATVITAADFFVT